MQSCEVVMKSGTKVLVSAKVLFDDRRNTREIFFYSDHDKSVVVATFKRDEIAGMIFHPNVTIMGSETAGKVILR